MLNETETIDPTASDNGTHGQILKSSALIGGSSLLNIGVGIVRTKIMALLLNPAGFGLFGIYGSISSLAQCLAGVGINSSGVRQIAEAVSSGSPEKIARTAAVLRKASILLGALGAVLLAVFANKISTLTFGGPQQAGAIVLLSFAVFFQLVANGQNALLQGMRRIRDLAKAAVLSAVFGALLSISLVYFLRAGGVVPSLVAVAVVSCSVSWWFSRKDGFSRKEPIPAPSLTASQVAHEASALLKLGLAFMTSYLMTMGTAYAVRVILLRRIGFAAAGYYQSAWTLGGLYVGFILEAMGADFYPRLTACAEDNAACNRLVNEQTHVGLLLAGPGVIATLTLAPLVIVLFYSTKFGAAVEVLRWICLGTILQVIAWPMSYMIVAKNKRALYFATELGWGVISLSLAWICIRAFGLNGAGIAFFSANVVYCLFLLPTVSWLSGFRWSSGNWQSGLIFLSLIALVFSGFHLLPLLWAAAIGILASIVSAAYSVRVMIRLIPWDYIPQTVRRVLVALKLAPSDRSCAN